MADMELKCPALKILQDRMRRVQSMYKPSSPQVQRLLDRIKNFMVVQVEKDVLETQASPDGTPFKPLSERYANSYRGGSRGKGTKRGRDHILSDTGLMLGSMSAGSFTAAGIAHVAPGPGQQAKAIWNSRLRPWLGWRDSNIAAVDRIGADWQEREFRDTYGAAGMIA
jgi:hypothetical protein